MNEKTREKPNPGIVVLTGAGISRESGLDTFRDADGIWSRVRIEDVATPEAFARDPRGGCMNFTMRAAPDWRRARSFPTPPMRRWAGWKPKGRAGSSW